MVEEDRTTADRLVEVLADRGYTVLAAPGAEEALAVASLHPGAIDLLIADVMLARLNGAELAARLRQTRPSLRTLFVVGDIGEPDPRLVLHAPEGLARPRPRACWKKSAAHCRRAPCTARATWSEGGPGPYPR